MKIAQAYTVLTRKVKFNTANHITINPFSIISNMIEGKMSLIRLLKNHLMKMKVHEYMQQNLENIQELIMATWQITFTQVLDYL